MITIFCNTWAFNLPNSLEGETLDMVTGAVLTMSLGAQVWFQIPRTVTRAMREECLCKWAPESRRACLLEGGSWSQAMKTLFIWLKQIKWCWRLQHINRTQECWYCRASLGPLTRNQRAASLISSLESGAPPPPSSSFFFFSFCFFFLFCFVFSPLHKFYDWLLILLPDAMQRRLQELHSMFIKVVLYFFYNRDMRCVIVCCWTTSFPLDLNLPFCPLHSLY